jgi:hypothetical protein
MKAGTGRALARGGLLAAAAALAGLAGCGGAERYGDALTLSTVTAVSDVLAAPASFEGRTVRIEGEISRECPSGCWFDVKDGAATVYVDIAPAGLAIPQRVGRRVAVEGTVSVEDGQVRFIGKGVEIR